MGDKQNTSSLICPTCDKMFKRSSNVKRHSKKVHGIKLPTRNKFPSKYKCPLCANVLKSYDEYKDHVLVSHDVGLQMYFYKFKSQSQFLAWKKKVEKETTSWYIKEKRTVKRLEKKQVSEETKPCITKLAGNIYYNCHRSGYFRAKNDLERKRRLKAQGTVKINAYCPAMISAKFQSKGTVKVIYCPTHVGHKCEVSHLQLTEEERKEITAKIAAKIPFDEILDEIRKTAVSSNTISRIHLLSKQDLRRLRWSVQKDQSNLESNPSNDSSQHLFTITQPDDMHSKELDEDKDIEILTYDPNDPDSESDSSLDGKIQPHTQFNVHPKPKPTSSNKYLQFRTPHNISSPVRRRLLPITNRRLLPRPCRLLSGFSMSQKKNKQSSQSASTSEQGSSSSQTSSSLGSQQDSFRNPKCVDMFGMGVDVLNPNDSNSSPDTKSINCGETGKIQLPKEVNVGFSSSSVNQCNKMGADQSKSKLKVIYCPTHGHKCEVSHLQLTHRYRGAHSNLSSNGNHLIGSSVSLKQCQLSLIEKFRERITKLSSLKEIEWVEHHIDSMFGHLNSVKEKNAILSEGFPIKENDQQNYNFSSSKQSPKQREQPHRSEIGLKNALSMRNEKNLSSKFAPNKFPPQFKLSNMKENMSQGLSSKPKLYIQSSLVKCSPGLKTNQKKSACYSIQQRVPYTALKPISHSTAQTLTSGRKQYLIPIVDEPGKYLIVQKKLNEPAPLMPLDSSNKSDGKQGKTLIVQSKPSEPPPLRPMTPEPPNQKQCCRPNNEVVSVDHSYAFKRTL